MHRRYLLVVVAFFSICFLVFMSRLSIVRAGTTPPIDYVTITPTYVTNSLKAPTGVYISPSSPNDLWISDTGHNQVDDFSGGHLFVTAGSGSAGFSDGTLTSATFNSPTGLSGRGHYEVSGPNGPAFNVTQLLVYDSANNATREICQVAVIGNPAGSPGPGCFSPSGVKTVAGNGQAGFINGTGSGVRMNVPLSTAGTTSAGYFADAQNNVVRTLQPPQSGGTTATVTTATASNAAGFVNGPLSSAKFNAPTAVVSTPSGSYYVADTGNFAIRRIDSSGNVTTFSGNGIQGYKDGAASSAQFASPLGMAVNPSNGYIYLADALNNCIRQIDTTGNVSTYSGTNKSGLVDGSLLQARYANPSGLTIYAGIMYVADTNNNAIRQINMSTGQVSTLIH